ncbi:MAG: sigma-70 family RNA polymerase sigma factor [Turneriella sp.]|nr:sigma-70 family RNA polymerase sigma factor [Turneriella sp.]
MSTSVCLDTIQQYPTLTEGQEYSLALATFNGCEKSKKRLILHLLQILIKSVRGYRLDSDLYNDCLSEGTIALIKAVDNFNPHRGFSISSYVSWFIHSAIRTTLRKQNNLISIPKNQWYKAKSQNQARQTAATTTSTLFNGPLPQATVFSDLSNQEYQLSSHSRIDEVSASAEQEYLREAIAEGLGKLDSFTVQIIRKRFGLSQENPVSSRKLAKQMQCSRSAILKAEEAGLRQLRHFFVQKGLGWFLQGE